MSKSVFIGAYVSGNSSKGPVSFEMYYLGSLVATSISLIQTSVPTFLASGYAGLVDEVRVIGKGGVYVLDNITYDAANVNAVPVPAAAWLFATGLAGLGLTQRKRAKLVG
ncbi:VPLPA-CTERM sorting domain-containing protein [Methylocucumis oryzae]|uniref:VPLPA-CTERM sorting domain-containing protein n=1 Tax=Methylocucumis oryzae TaxID=1632867 RepID=A0A0F3IL60_9GAMM|nr:VPLPA-CTERM sorting domain-containing protein [Methylocucumis oryzae]KJV06294.1 hypothetical protein VZ94_12225 [Methylocucumis oryzae]